MTRAIAPTLSALVRSVRQVFPQTSRAATAAAPAAQMSTLPPAVLANFSSAQNTIIGDLESSLGVKPAHSSSASDVDIARRASFAVGHKLVAQRTTVKSRLYAQLQNFYDNPIAALLEVAGDDESLKKQIRERIKANALNLSFTTHPTEGQNLRAIQEKDSIVKLQVNLIRAEREGKVSPENLVILQRLALLHGLDFSAEMESVAAEELMPFERFQELSRMLQKRIIDSFAHNPIHHTKKMTVEDERKLLRYHMGRCRWEGAALVARFSDVMSMDAINIFSWAGDMDGKPHIPAGHGVIFERELQSDFFKALVERLQEVERCMKMRGQDIDTFRHEVIDRVKFLSSGAEGKILVGAEAKMMEEEISKILSEFEKSCEEPLGELFAEAKCFVEGSGCKTAKIGFTTREETDNSVAAFKNLARVCLEENPEFAAEIGEGADLEKTAKFFITHAADPRIAEALARGFSRLPDGKKKGEVNAKRQVLCLLEALSLHPTHTHIISQCDCRKDSYLAILALCEVVKNSAEQLGTTDAVRGFYAELQKEAGFDFHSQLFSEAAVARTRQAQLRLSPLAEEKKTIERLTDFTADLLADDVALAQLHAAGDVLEQTRSNSDGSSSLGPQAVVARYLEADIAIEKMAKAAGLRLEVLSGMGANDADRMAPLSLRDLSRRYTVQGGDMQHLSAPRFATMLAQEPRNPSQEAMISFQEKYADCADEYEKMLEFYYRQHVDSEEGVEIELDSKTVMSAHTTHRGPIPGTVVQILGRLSSRPDSRTGDVGGDGFSANSIFDLHKSVFNPAMRRIGAISLQRASGMSTFLLAPFYHPYDGDEEMLHDFCQIPLIRNSNLLALFALGTADIKSFMLANGLERMADAETLDESIGIMARDYEEFLEINRHGDAEAIAKFAADKGFDSPDYMRCSHLSYQVVGARSVLRNAMTPLLLNSSPEVKDRAEALFRTVESGSLVKDYHVEVIKICETLANDEAQDIETRRSAACIAQQIDNVRKKGNFYDTRAKLVEEAHQALRKSDQEKFQTACTGIAIAMRSAGNPLSPGRKIEELLRYFVENFETTFPMAHLLAGDKHGLDLGDSRGAGSGGKKPSSGFLPFASTPFVEAKAEQLR